MGMTTTKPALSLQELRAAGKQVAREAGGGTVAAFFDANKDTLKALLPAHMTPDRMLKIALGALRTTPKLMQCTVESLFGAVVYCAQMGLEPNTPQGHIYLIPFENKRKGVTEVQIVTGFKGLVDLARRSNQIVSISARVRHERDEFRMLLGTADEIHHVPADGDRGKALGFYAVAKLKDGGVQFEYMSLTEIEKVRDQSQGYKTAVRFGKADSPWMAHFDEMAKKTVVRRLCKMLPMSIELRGAEALDARADAGMGQSLDSVLEGQWEPAEELEAIEAPPAVESAAPADGEIRNADETELSGLAGSAAA
jgi:recombination protein RecT